MAQLPEFTKTEKIEPSATPLPVSGQLREVGEANFLSTLGADIGMRAGIARSEMAGIRMGKTPSGDLLPAINKSDEAFGNAYRTTANAVLTNQGTQLLNQSLNTVAAAGKMTPQVLASFEDNMQKGIDAIVAQAPSVDQEVLRNNLTAQYLNTQGKLHAKLIQQQKDDIKDNFAVYSSNTNTQIFDLSMSGDKEAAQSLYETYRASAQQMVDNGLISNLDRETLLKSARINMMTGDEFSKAQAAKERGELDIFLSEFGKKPPEGMSQSEWIEVGGKLLELVNYQTLTDSKNQSLLVSEGSLRIAQGEVTEETLLRFKTQMTPENYNKFLTSYTIDQQRRKDSAEKVQYVFDNWNKPGALALAENGAINKAYDAQWKSVAQQSGLDDWTAKTLTASTLPVKIPDYIDELNAKAISGIPQDMTEALHGMQSLNAKTPASLEGFNETSRNMLSVYSVARAGGQDDVVAANTAVKAVLEVDETEANRRKQIWMNISVATFGERDVNLKSKVFNMLGVKASEVEDEIGTALRFKELYRVNYYATGNQEAAKKTTLDQIKASHGYTMVNGKKQFVHLPIERVMDITPTELPFVYKQMNNQVELQLKGFNELYNKKQSDFKYEFTKTEVIDDAKYLDAQQKLGTLMQDTNMTRELLLGASRSRLGKNAGKINDIVALQKIVRQYENPGRPIITRTYRDGTKQDFYLNIYSQSGGDLYAGLPIYNVVLEDMSGEVQEFIGADGYNGRNVLFAPNKDKFVNDYITTMEIQAAGGNTAMLEAKQKFDDHLRKAKETVESKRLESDVTITNDNGEG